MASNTFILQTVDGKQSVCTRTTKQGRKPSPDPLTAITVRLPKSWLEEMSDARHEIFCAVKEYRTRKLYNS